MFKTLDDLKGKDEKAKDDKKKTNSYAGGEKSGIAIENPDDIESIVNKAKENTGSSSQKTQVKTKITLYKNGFKVDDGEFREYTKPENKKFVQELKNGQIPTELRNKFKSAQLDVGLEDKRSEQYVPPPPPSYIAFSGTGQSMGSTSTGGKINLKAEQIKINPNKPKTIITIRLYDGTTKQIEVNTDQPTDSIYTYVQRVSSGNFQLIAGFPPRPIKKGITVEDADLCDSRVTQKLI